MTSQSEGVFVCVIVSRFFTSRCLFLLLCELAQGSLRFWKIQQVRERQQKSRGGREGSAPALVLSETLDAVFESLSVRSGQLHVDLQPHAVLSSPSLCFIQHVVVQESGVVLCVRFYRSRAAYGAVDVKAGAPQLGKRTKSSENLTSQFLK